MERTDKQFWATVGWVSLLILTAAFVAHFLTSCTTQRLIKRTDKAAVRLFARDSVKGIKTVAKYVPIQERVKVTTRTIKGKTDTIEVPVVYTVDCDSAIMATLDEAARHHVKCPDCPPSTVRVDTFIRDSLHVVIDPNTAADLMQARKDIEFYKAKYKSRTWYVWTFWIGLIVIVLIAAGLIYNYVRGSAFKDAERLVGTGNK